MTPNEKPATAKIPDYEERMQTIGRDAFEFYKRAAVRGNGDGGITAEAASLIVRALNELTLQVARLIEDS